MNKKQYIRIIIGIIIFLGFIFYWYDLKPRQIRKECAKAELHKSVSKEIREFWYETCLRGNGLEK